MSESHPPSRTVAAGPAPGDAGKRDGERYAPMQGPSSDGTHTADGGSPSCASSPLTVEQLQRAEIMLRAGHALLHITAATGVPHERPERLRRTLITTRRSTRR